MKKGFGNLFTLLYVLILVGATVLLVKTLVKGSSSFSLIAGICLLVASLFVLVFSIILKNNQK